VPRVKPFNRVILIVLDGVGVGALPDAADYGDADSHTLAHVARAVGGVTLPNLEMLGLGNVADCAGLRPVGDPEGCYGRMAEASKGKDTTVGHWEMAGVVSERPFPTYPHGFPPDLIERFQEVIGRRVLGNRPASGTAIIHELGEAHERSGSPIVYTSADSVFQIAAHEEVIAVEDLYEMCRHARRLLRPPHQVARVIARPFVGAAGAYRRTARRRDFSVDPPAETLLDALKAAGYPVVGIGKIDDLFNGRGLTRSVPTGSNAEGMAETIRTLGTTPRGLIFVNLLDFDTLYGHRNDAAGFARALEEFDRWLSDLYQALRPADLVAITADHGNDPTGAGTDHTREYVPLLVHGSRSARGVHLGTRATFADLGQTIADAFGLKRLTAGESFLDALAAGT
jgi:phosphopentomutase